MLSGHLKCVKITTLRKGDKITFSADFFQGITCSSDAECDYLSTQCDISKGVCNVKPLAEVEAAFVHCYINTMSSEVEVDMRISMTF